jgi:hypothetical protein
VRARASDKIIPSKYSTTRTLLGTASLPTGQHEVARETCTPTYTLLLLRTIGMGGNKYGTLDINGATEDSFNRWASAFATGGRSIDAFESCK